MQGRKRIPPVTFYFLNHENGIGVADPDPGSGAILTPGSGIRDGQKIKIRTWD